MDETTAHIGTSAGHFSRGDAKKEAMLRCANGGSKNCKVVFAYKNQCAILAWASDHGELVGGVSITQSANSIDEATRLGLAACKAKRNGEACEIVYSECTVPVRVR